MHPGRVLVQAALVVLLAALLAPPGAHAAVADFLGKPVAAVRLVIEGRKAADEMLAELVETRVGQPLAMAAVRESLTHLFSLGRFEDVRVDAALGVNGVVLEYQLVPVHTVTNIAFEGTTDAPGVDVGQLRRTLVDRYGTSPPIGRSAELARALVDALRDAGYRRAVVRPRADLRHDPDRATLVFVLECGPRTRVGTIDVQGATESEADLLGQLDLARGAPYLQRVLEERIERYVAARRRRGYYEAKIISAVTYADDERVANLSLTVLSGPRVRVVFTGDTLPSDARTDLVPVEREGSADEDLLEDSANQIQDYLHAQGYRDAKARFTRELTNGELTITFDVRRGPLYRVERVEVAGNAAVALQDFQPVLRLRAGLPFSAGALDSDVSAIVDFYRRRGYASTQVKASVAVDEGRVSASQAQLTIRIVVTEGIRTMIGTVSITGNVALPEAELQRQLGLRPGGPYFEARLHADSDVIGTAYANLGYSNATVQADPKFSADRSQANPVFTVREGPRQFVDHVIIVGNVRTKTEIIQRELRLKPGDPLSRAAELESQQRLAALGLFRRTQVTEVRHGEEGRRDIIVTVEEAPVTTIGFGGGFEVGQRVVRLAADPGVASDEIELAPRASFEIGRRNLFGKNRSINLFSSFSFHPRVLPSFDSASSSVDGAINQYRVIGTFREPRAFGSTLDAFVTAVLEQQIRSSFNFVRRGANLEIGHRLGRGFSASGSYQIQRTRVFDASISPSDQRLVDRLFPQVLLSSFSSSVVHDTRDDVLDAASGHYASVNAQLAARAIGSEVGFAKTLFTTQVFRTLPRTNRVVFAGSARVGLAHAFPRVAGTEVVEDLPASERFFAGGDTTVRGYSLDTLGTPQTKDSSGFPIGGGGLVILNAELRVPVWRGRLQMVGFLDTGNVFVHPTDIRLSPLRSAAGFGVRFRSPVGPIRFDLGFKLQRDEITPGVREGLTAIHVSFGQAF